MSEEWGLAILRRERERDRERERERERERACTTKRENNLERNSWELKGVIWALSKELLLVGNYKPTIQISCKPNSKPGPLSKSWVHTIIIIIIIIILYMLNEAYKKGIYYIISLKLIYFVYIFMFSKIIIIL